MARKIVNGKHVKSSGPYSHAVDAGDYVFLAGQTGYNGSDYNGEAYDIETQTHKSFEHLEDIMEEVGLWYDHVVKVNVYLTSMDDFKAMNDVYASKFTEAFPARTCIAVVGLPLNANVEIEFILKRNL